MADTTSYEDGVKAMLISAQGLMAAASALTGADTPRTIRSVAAEAYKQAKAVSDECAGLCDAMETSWLDAQKSEWSAAQVNDLPDSAFLYVSPGGSKDADGKTTPRSLRHFPVRGPDGKPDAAHVRNALARIPQAGVPDAAKAAATAAAQRMLAELKKG